MVVFIFKFLKNRSSPKIDVELCVYTKEPVQVFNPHMLLEVLKALIAEEFYDSALLLSEFLYNTQKASFENHNFSFLQNSEEITLLVLLIETLRLKGLYNRIYNFILCYPILLCENHIKSAFLKSLVVLNKSYDDWENQENSGLSVDLTANYKINPLSVSKLVSGLYSAMNGNPDRIVEAFSLDERNLEALYILKTKYLLPKSKFLALIENMSNKGLQVVYNILFKPLSDIEAMNFYIKDSFITSFDIFSPNSAHKLHKHFILKNLQIENTNLISFMLDNFPNETITYIILCSFYLNSNLYNNAHNAISHAIKIKNTDSLVQLYCGHVYAKLNDPLNAIDCYKKAKNKMGLSYKPYLYLAIEYKKYNEAINSRVYFYLSANNDKNPLVLSQYARFLFETEESKLFAEILEILRKNLAFTKDAVYRDFFYVSGFIYYLIKNKNDKMYKMIENINKKSKKAACYGLVHIVEKNWDKAAANFIDILLEDHKNEAINTLLEIALNQTVFTQKIEYLDLYTCFYLELTKDIDTKLYF